MADVLIERIVIIGERIPKEAAPGILASFAEVMDLEIFSSWESDFGMPRAWPRAVLAVELLMKGAGREIRQECIRVVFFEGKALGWATSILRGEIFNHGLYGERTIPEEQRLLRPAEFKLVLERMLRRYRETPPDELMEVPRFLSLLFAWLQGGGRPDVEAWVEENTRTDAGLLEFLSRVRTPVVSNKGAQYPLRREDLSYFLNYDSAMKRVNTIFNDPQSPPEMRQLAKELIQAAQIGEGLR